MSRVIEVSDTSYQALEEAARRRGQTPEMLVEALIAAEAGHDHPIYEDLDDFFRSLGASEDVIRESQRIYANEWQHAEPANPESLQQSEGRASNDADL